MLRTTNGHPTSTTGYEPIYVVRYVVSGEREGACQAGCASPADTVGGQEKRILWRRVFEDSDRRHLAPRDVEDP